MPTPNVSIVDLVIQVEKKTFAEEVNAAFQEAASGPMKVLYFVQFTGHPFLPLCNFKASTLQY